MNDLTLIELYQRSIELFLTGASYFARAVMAIVRIFVINLRFFFLKLIGLILLMADAIDSWQPVRAEVKITGGL